MLSVCTACPCSQIKWVFEYFVVCKPLVKPVSESGSGGQSVVEQPQFVCLDSLSILGWPVLSAIELMLTLVLCAPPPSPGACPPRPLLAHDLRPQHHLALMVPGGCSLPVVVQATAMQVQALQAAPCSSCSGVPDRSSQSSLATWTTVNLSFVAAGRGACHPCHPALPV
jgi:hypothetical protein